MSQGLRTLADNAIRHRPISPPTGTSRLPVHELDRMASGICGGGLRAKAAEELASCIVLPHVLEAQAKGKAASKSEQIADLNTLSLKQLRTLAKRKRLSIARTKADFILVRRHNGEPGVVRLRVHSFSASLCMVLSRSCSS